MTTGTVKWFNTSKGFGFIEPDDKSKDVFVHVTALKRANIAALDDGQRVSFELTSENGKTTATELKLLGSRDAA